MISLIANWRKCLQFYSTWIIILSGVLDIAVFGWTAAENMLPIGPLKFLAITLLLKLAALIARVISQTGLHRDADEQRN